MIIINQNNYHQLYKKLDECRAQLFTVLGGASYIRVMKKYVQWDILYYLQCTVTFKSATSN